MGEKSIVKEKNQLLGWLRMVRRFVAGCLALRFAQAADVDEAAFFTGIVG